MTRTRLILCLALIGAMGACGGRSGLHVLAGGGDGGGVGDGGRADGRLDGRLDGVPTDARLDGVPTDARLDGVPTDARLDGVPTDARLDVPATDARRDVGGTGGTGGTGGIGGIGGIGGTAGNDGGRDVPTTTGGSPDASVDAAPTLSSIQISSLSSPIVVNVGTPVPFTVTAIYSDNSKADVTSSAQVTSSNTAVLTISGTNLVGAGTANATATITATYQGKTATANVTIVGNNPLVSISIDQVPTSPLAIGQTVNLVATGVFTDGTKQDLTSQATWTSSAPAVATVGDTGTTKGQVTGVAAGTFTVTATVAVMVSGTAGTVSGTSTQMTVNGTKKLVSIQITPSQPTMQRGLTNQPFKATGTYDDNSAADVTQQATWTSSNTAVLAVVSTGATAGNVSTVAAGTATVTATVGTIFGTDLVTVTPGALRTITVTCQGQDVIVVGNPQQCTALGTYAGGSTADLTSAVTWSSNNTAVLTVSNAIANPGLASGVTEGTATISATFTGITGRKTVTVSAAPLISITVNPSTLNNVIVGLTSQLTATGLYGTVGNTATQFSIDVTTSASWSVLDSTVATVGNSATTDGQVTGVAAGSTTVTATLSGQKGQATVNVVNTKLVSIAVSPLTASVRVGLTYQFQAKGTFDNNTTRDITTDVTWTSSDTTIATISNAAGTNGLATGVAASTTPVNITATLQGVVSAPAAQLTVDVARLVSIQIAPSAAQTINVNATQGYTVTGVYENGTTTTALTGVTWQSSDPTVATVAANPAGRGPAVAGATATGVAAGTTTISASYTPTGGTALTDSVTLNVNKPVSPIGIRLNNLNDSIAVNETVTYTAYLDYDNGTSTTLTTGVTLTTSNGVVASVVPAGPFGFGLLQVTGQAAGTVTVTATYTTGGTTYTTNTQLTVTAVTVKTQTGLYITPSSASVKVNGTQQFQAHATYSDGTETVVTNDTSCSWTTSDGTLATVTDASNTGLGRGGVFGGGAGGLATGLAVGTPTINATYGGFSATAQLTVTAPPVLQSLSVTGPANTLHVGQSQTYVATAYYSDGTSAVVTGSATWSTSDPNVAVVSTSPTGRGGPGAVVGGSTVTALATGTVSIQASYTENGITVTGSASLTVNAPTVIQFHITPTLPTIHTAISTTLTFVAQVIYSDNSVATVTASTDWASSNGAVAVISNSGATTGRATGLTAGTTTITGTFQGSTDSTTLTVSAATLSKLNVTPPNPTMHLGINQSFAAVVTLSDNYTQTVTTSATWMSSDSTVVAVGATTGVATPVKSGGPVTITATYQGVSGTSQVTVSSATLSSIAITPNPLSVAVGGSQQLTATGTWADTPPTSADITNNVTWMVSGADGGVTTSAAVSNAAGSRGLLTAISVGSVTVSAVFQNVTGNLAGTVTASP